MQVFHKENGQWPQSWHHDLKPLCQRAVKGLFKRCVGDASGRRGISQPPRPGTRSGHWRRCSFCVQLRLLEKRKVEQRRER